MASSSLYQKFSQLPLLESPKGKCPSGSNSSHGEWPQSQSPDPAYCALHQEMTQSFQCSAVLPSKVTSLQVIITKKRAARNKGLRLKLRSLCENVLVYLKLILTRYIGRHVSKLHCTLHNGSLKL